MLAAGAVSAFVERVKEIVRAPGAALAAARWLRLATLLPLLLVLAEGLNATPHPVVPPQPAGDAHRCEGRCWCCPATSCIDKQVMLWSTDRFQDDRQRRQRLHPGQLDEIRRVTTTFPDQASVDYLRELGVKHRAGAARGGQRHAVGDRRSTRPSTALGHQRARRRRRGRLRL